MQYRRCDICGKEIGYESMIVVTAYRVYGKLRHDLPYEYVKGYLTGADLEKRTDLCEECADATLRFLTARAKGGLV